MKNFKIKTATITFQNADNYGAMLQAYGLQKALLNEGFENEIIDYRSNYLDKPWSKRALVTKGFIRYLLGIAYYIVRFPRIKKFNLFRSEQLKLTNRLNKRELITLNEKYNFFIVGSDQVWNYLITNNDKAYHLDFVSNRYKKISYAASFGLDIIPDHLVEDYRTSLLDFSFINVREERAVEIVKELTGRAGILTLDPCFLLKQTDWDKIVVEVSIKNYLLVYQTTLSSEVLNMAEIVAKERNLRIITIPFPLGRLIKSSICLTAGPREWLGLLKNADFIVTDSFHGSVFSIIYNKPFYVAITEGGSRIRSLLKIFGLENRLISKKKSTKSGDDIDWGIVNQILLIEKSKSLQILTNSFVQVNE